MYGMWAIGCPKQMLGFSSSWRSLSNIKYICWRRAAKKFGRRIDRGRPQIFSTLHLMRIQTLSSLWTIVLPHQREHPSRLIFVGLSKSHPPQQVRNPTSSPWSHCCLSTSLNLFCCCRLCCVTYRCFLGYQAFTSRFRPSSGLCFPCF